MFRHRALRPAVFAAAWPVAAGCLPDQGAADELFAQQMIDAAEGRVVRRRPGGLQRFHRRFANDRAAGGRQGGHAVASDLADARSDAIDLAVEQRLDFGAGGAGELHHVALVAFQRQQGHVPGALLAKQLDVQFGGQGLKLPWVEQGHARISQDEGERGHQAIAPRPQPAGVQV